MGVNQHKDQDLLNKLSLYMTILLPPLVLISLSRIFSEGFLPAMAVHVFLGVFQLVNHYFIKDKFPSISEAYFIFLFFTVGIAAIFQNQDVYYGSPFFIIAMLFASIFFRRKFAIGTLLLSICVGYAISIFYLDSIRHLMIIGPGAIGLVVVVIFSNLKIKLQKTAQDAIEFGEKLEAELKLKKKFFATMTHELRTPLNGIVGGAEALQLSSLNSDQKEMLDIIAFSNSVLIDIVNDILDFSKLDTDQFELYKEAFVLEDLIEKVLSLHQISADKKKIKLNFYNEIDKKKYVYADEIRLCQVLNNLLSNAIKFTEKGEVSLTVSQKNTNDIEKISFKIKDTGIGIKDEFKADLFSPFTQENVSSTRKYGGTGLGLSICKELVKLMGGDIKVKSNKGKGSTFTFYISYTKDELIKSKSKEEIIKIHNIDLSSEFKELKILVAEDNTVNLKVIKSYLKRLNVSADYVENGQDVLSKLKESRYDIIFMDFQMPVMSGVEATRQIRKKSNQKDIYIIGCSANLKEGESVVAYEMDSALGKPLTLKMIKSELHKYLIKKHRDNSNVA